MYYWFYFFGNNFNDLMFGYFVNYYNLNFFFIKNLIFNNFFFTFFFLMMFLCFIFFNLRFFLITNVVFNGIVFFIFFIINVFKQQLGYFGQNFINLILCFFCFVLLANYFGMIIFGFTLTSHIILDFFLSFLLLFSLTCAGFDIKGFSFLLIFLPSSAPFFLKPLLVVIELISYIARGFSLAIRLFANLMAGHALLNILCSFVIDLEFFSVFISLLPFFIVIFVAFLEFGIAFIQSYVFLTLCCLYLKDVFLSH